MRNGIAMASLAGALLGACMIDSTTFTPLDDDAGTGGDCDAGCETPSVPQPRLPMNNAYVGLVTAEDTLRPTFVWEPAGGSAGGIITYEIDYSTDSSFATGVTTASTTMTSHRPADPLDVSARQPVGARYYWRVRACRSNRCSENSPTWWVNVGRSNSDFNGDGLADMIIGAPGTDSGLGELTGTAYLVLGREQGAFSWDDNYLGDAKGDGLGARVAFAGDVNADGFSDVLVGALAAGPGDRGSFYVYLGSPTGQFSLAFEVTAEAAANDFGVVAAAGDVNRDGFDDVLVGSPLANVDVGALGAGRAYLYLGGPGAVFDSTPDATLDGASTDDHFGRSAASAGDVNGDGFADLIIGAEGSDAGGLDAGRAFVYFGSEIPIDFTPDATITGADPGDNLGWSVAGAGDLNRDGFSDVLVGAYSNDSGGVDAGIAHVYFGGPGASLDTTPEGSLMGAAGDLLGFSVASAGDVNDDGFGDVIVGAGQSDLGGPDHGTAFVYFGGPGATFDTTAEGTLNGAVPGQFFGISVASAGDVNGDGFADLIVGATPLGGPSTGAAYIYFGGAAPTVDATFDGEMFGVAAGDLFGTSVD